MAKRKRTKGQTTIYKDTHKTKDRVTRTPLKPGMNSCAPEGGTRRANLVTKPVIMLLILPMRGLILSNLGCELRHLVMTCFI